MLKVGPERLVDWTLCLECVITFFFFVKEAGGGQKVTGMCI